MHSVVTESQLTVELEAWWCFEDLEWIQPMKSQNTRPIGIVCAGTELLTECLIKKALTAKDVFF